MDCFVKICGNRSEADAQRVAELKPNAMGFIFWPHSSRAVTPEQVAAWLPNLPSEILMVGVFVDTPPEQVNDIVGMTGLHVAQLHGEEAPEACAQIEGAKWKVVHPGKPDMLPMDAYSVDAFLLDSYSKHAPGGTGKVFDWNLARELMEFAPAPVLLAGGLTPENVQDAIAAVRPWGVDVISGVESEPGKKDMDKVKRFIEACRS